MKLQQEIIYRGKNRESEALQCNTCNTLTLVSRCLKCGKYNCDGCSDARECLPCRMNRLLGRATSCIILSLLATTVFDCLALWIKFEIYSFLGCFFTGFSTVPFGLASLLASMTLLQVCRARFHDKKVASRLLSRTLVLTIMAAGLVFLKMVYYMVVFVSQYSYMREMMAGELGIAGIFFIATFFISRFKSTSRDAIVQRTLRLIVWAYFYTSLLNYISQIFFIFAPGEIIAIAALPIGTIFGISSLVVIILANMYIAGVIRKGK